MINKSLDKLFIVKDGTHDSPKYVSSEEGYPLITSKNLKSGELDFINVNYISQKDFDKINERSKVDKGDLLFAMIGTIGNPITVKIDPLFAIKNVALFKPNEETNSIEYLRFVLKSELIKRKLLKNSKGGTQKFISLGNLRRLQIPIPETKKQQLQIVSILSKCESLINQRKESIELADEFLKHTFLTMFGDVLKNSKDWPTVSFEKLVRLKRGYDLPKSQRLPGKHPLFAANGQIDSVDEFKVQGPGIVTGRSGTIGKVIFVKDDYWPLNTALYSERFSGNPIYLHYLLRFFKLERFSKGAGVPTLNRNLVHKKQIIDTPIDLQEKFVQIVNNVESLKKRYLESLNELNNLYQSLSYKAFNGELTLIEKTEIKGSIKVEPKISGTIKIIEHEPPITTIPQPIKKKEEVITHIPFLNTEDDLLGHISRNCSGSHFTFEDIKKAVKGLDWKYDFEELKNLLFKLVRNKQLKQIFADASYKSGFSKSDAEFKEIIDLSEQIYFKRML